MDDRTDRTANETTPFNPNWKWRALFDRPAPLDAAWAAWLAEAQRAEQDAELRFWAHRRAA